MNVVNVDHRPAAAAQQRTVGGLIKVVYRGVQYRTLSAWLRAVFPGDPAAQQRLRRAFDVHPELTLDEMIARAQGGWRTTLCTVNGRRLTSVLAVARELGVSSSWVNQRLAAGEQLADIVAQPRRRVAQPVVVDGRVFANRRAACEALGVNYSTAAGVMRRHGLDFGRAVERILRYRGVLG